MNKIYRIIFNTATGRWVVASEMAKGRKKVTRSARTVLAAGFMGGALCTSGLATAGALDGGNNNGFPTSVAIGTSAVTLDQDSVAIGVNAQAQPANSVAIGDSALVDSNDGENAGVAVGTNSHANGVGTAVGYTADASGTWSTAVGPVSTASGAYSVAIGAHAAATAANSVALGSDSTTTANLAAAGYNPGSAALSGTASAANGEVSIGAAGKERRLTNLAAGSAPTDAVNVSQLQAQDASVDLQGTSTAAALGGGAAYNAASGAISAPSYALGNANAINGTTGAAADVGTAFVKVDGALGTVNADLTALGGRVTTAEGDISNIRTDVSGIDGRVSQNETDIANIDGRVTSVEGDVTNLTTQINNGSVGLVQQDEITRTITVAKDANGALVDFAGTGGARKLTGVFAGDLSATSVDAVNGSQLFATNQNVAQNATDISALDGRVTTNEGDITAIKSDVTNIGGRVTTAENNITSLDGRVTQNEGDITNLYSQLDSGSVGLVQQDATTRMITVAKDTDGTLVNFAGTDGARTLTGVLAGDLSATSVDAVNGSQLFATNQNVAQNTTDISTLDGRVTTNEGDIATIRTDVTSIDGRVTQNEGDITSLDGRVTTNEGDISNIKTDVTNIGGRVTTVEGNVSNLYTQINSGSIGLVQQAAAGGKLTVGSGTDGNDVDFANNAGRARRLTRVAAGTGAEDAVNVSQLKPVVDGLGGGASIDPVTGLVTGPTYVVTNADGSQSSVHTVGDAVTNLDGRVYNNTTQITHLTNQISSGSVGLVQQAGAGQKLTVGKDTDGREVSFTNAAGESRKLSGVAAGTVSAASTDAINGSQLHGLSQSVTTALGGGSAVNADGSISAPAYTVTNADGTTSKVAGVEGAITNIDGRVYNNTVRIDNVETNVNHLTSQINSGAVGLVQQAAPGEQLTVGKSTDGTSVNFTGTAGDRVLTGVAAGKADSDAVNMGQLKASGLVDEKGQAKAVVAYDSADKSSVTLGGEAAAKPVALHNVAAGVSDHDAVNVSQLNARLQAQNNTILSQANNYADDRFKSAMGAVDDLRSDVDDRFQVQDARIDRLSAMSSAMATMTSSMSGVNRINRVGVGAGETNGRLAMAVGYQRAFRDGGATLTAGATFTDEDSSVGVGAGFGW